MEGSEQELFKRRSRVNRIASSYSMQSEFTLNNSDSEEEDQKQNIGKILNRLGLEDNKDRNLEALFEDAAAVFLKKQINADLQQQKEVEYAILYAEALKQKETKTNSYIFVSQFTDMEYLEDINQKHTLLKIYKNLRIAIKWISLICQSIVETSLFQSIVLIVIILNSIKMALEDPLSNTTSQQIALIQQLFLIFYVSEMSIKIIALGFIFNKGSYLRDPWNILDFFIVVTSLLPYVMTMSFNVSALRAIRVLRPLKTITKVKALKMIVKTLFLSFSLVMNSFYILLFVIIIFGIAGTQLFSGTLKYYCMDIATGVVAQSVCNNGDQCSNLYGAGFVCAKTQGSPHFSIYNFDTILWSMTTTFQTITLQSWSTIMLYLEEGYSFLSFIYSIGVIISCEYITLNMTMAILKYKYSEVKMNKIEEEEEQVEEYTPELLKKIGTFKNITELRQSPFFRYKTNDRAFVGSSYFFTSDMSYQRRKRINERLNKKFNNLKKQRRESKIQQLCVPDTKNIGWDPKTLHFQPISFDQIQLDENGLLFKKKPSEIEEIEEEQFDDKSSKGKKSEYAHASQMEIGQQSKIHSPNASSIEDEDQDVQQDKRSQSNSSQSVVDIPTEKLISFHNAPPKKSKLNDVFEFNKLLSQIENPQLKNDDESSDQQLLLPNIKMDQEKIDKFYNQFQKLDPIGVKKKQKATIAKLLSRMSRKSNSSKQAEKNVIAKVVQEGQLDIKQLQLANELSTKRLKCRIKGWKDLNQHTSYPVQQILISMKQKMQEEAKKQIQQKTKQIKSKITYIRPQTKNKNLEMLQNENSLGNIKYYQRRRKFPQDMSGILKIPLTTKVCRTMEIIQTKLEMSEMRLMSQQLQPAQRFADRLIKRNGMTTQGKQNLSLITELEMKEQDVLKHYFDSEKNNEKIRGNVSKKKTKKKKGDQQIEQKQLSNQQKYYQVKNDDIFKYQGQIEMRCSSEQILTLKPHQYELIEALNLTQKEYDIYVPSVKGIFISMHAKLLSFVEASLYDTIILLIVVFNTIMMCMSGLVNVEGEPWDTIDYAFTTIFVIDVTFKIIAYGFQFFQDPFSILDLVVSVISMVDANLATTNLSALKSLRVLRTLRVIRVAKLIRSLSYMKIIMSVVVTVLSQFLYVFLLLTLFMFIYTLLGMQTLGGTFVSGDVSGIRQNFDSFENAFFSVFQVLTVQNWDDVQTGIILSSNTNFTILYLISWIVLGNWILLNLAQAILLDGFDDDSVTAEITADASPSEKKQLKKKTVIIDNKTAQPTDQQPKSKKQQNLQQNNQDEEVYPETYTKQKQPEDFSLFLLSNYNPLRKFLMKIIDHCAFENFYLFLIVCSCGKLVFDTYIQPNDVHLNQISDNIDLFFNIVFIIEAAIKILGQGFIIGKKPYLESNWEKLDFIIVVTIIVDLSTSKSVNLKIIKLLRALRPLKIISKNLNMKIIISALGDSLTGMLNILVIIVTVFCMFGILGMNLLGGKLNYCNFPSPTLTYGDFGPYGVNSSQCAQQGGVWTTQFINFQNIFNSLLSLYVFSTRQNWPYYIYTFADAETDGPVLNNNFILFFIFAVVFIFTCSYFLMDLMVGILFMNFHAAQNKIRPKLLQDCQINWINLQKIIVQTDPCLALYLQPDNKFQKFFFKIVNNAYFDPIIIGIIVLNIFTMMAQMDDAVKALSSTITMMNLGYSCIFMLEMILKLLAYDKNYFLVGWNIFDFCVVMASILDIILTYAQGVSSTPALSVLPQIARIFRVLRVTKLLRLFKQFKGLQKLIETFIYMLPAFANGLALFLLYLFITSIVACFLMSGITGDSSGYFSGQNNFVNFHSSLQTLYITITGQNWYVYMFQSSFDGYVSCSTSEDCTQPVNFLFWLLFIFFGQKVFLQMLGLIVLDQFDYNYIRENNPLGVFALLQSDFRENWILISKKYKAEKMQSKKLVQFILNLRQPLGMSLGELQQNYESQLKQNDQLTPENVKAKVYQFYMKLKHSAARHVFKINSLLSQTYLTYHQTFYYLSKAAYYNQFVQKSTPFQLQLVDESNSKIEEQLLAKRDNKLVHNLNRFEMNPMQKILFFQMSLNAWARYTKTKLSKTDDQTLQQDESYIQSHTSIPEQVKLDQQQQSNVKRKGGILPYSSFSESNNNLGIPNTDIYEKSAWINAQSRNGRQKNLSVRPSIESSKKKGSKRQSSRSKSSKKSSQSKVE